MGLLGEMKVAFTADVTQLVAGVATAKSELTGISEFNPTGAIVGGLALAAAAAIGFAAVSVKMAADYQQSMNKVQALTGSSTQQMQDYDSSLKSLAVNAGVAPKALSDGLYNVISAGYKGAAAIQVLTLATEDSKIGMTSAAVTSDALTNVMASFSVKAGDATRVNGEMLETVTLGKATFEQYAQSIVKSASSASQFHVSMETMNAAWSTMTANGIRAAQASTDFQQSLKVMYSNIGTVTKSLQKNGIAFDENKFNAMSYGDKVVYLNTALQQANAQHVKVTGVTIQAAQAISTVAQHIDTYNSNLATLSNTQAMNQKTQEAWNITQGGFNQTMSRLDAAVQVMMINLGSKLLPILTQLVSAVIPIISSFASWLASSGALTIAAGALIGGLKTLGSVISGIITFFQQNKIALDALLAVLITVAIFIAVALVSAFVAWAIAAGAAAIATLTAMAPIILIGVVIAAVVLAIIVIIQHWGAISAWLTGVWQGIPGFFAGLWAKITGALGAFWQWVQNIFNTAVHAVLGFLQANWPLILAILTGPLGVITLLVIKFWPQIQGLFNAGMNEIHTILSSIGGTLYNIFIQPFVNAYNYISGIFSNISRLIGNVTSGVKSALHSVGIPGFAGGVQNFSGGFAMVGETGPELVYLPQGSNVYPSGTGPNGPTSASVPPANAANTASSTGNTGEQHIYIQLDGQTLAHVIGNQQARIVRVRQNRRVA